MKIVYKLGDMFASNKRCLIHSGNAQGVMGSGVAATLRKLHPAAYEAYRDAHETRGLSLGEVIWADSNGVLVGTLIGQDRYGRDKNVVYVDYDAIRSGIREVNTVVVGEYENVGMPMLGAGLANGNWSIISKIIEEESTNFTPIVYVIDPQIYRGLI